EGAPLIKAVREGEVAMRVGEQQNRAVEIVIAASIEGRQVGSEMVYVVPRFQATRALINLPAAKQSFAALLRDTPVASYNVRSGEMTLTLEGSYEPQKLVITALGAAVRGVTVDQPDERQWVRDLSLTLATRSEVTLGDDATIVALHTLDVDEPRNYLRIRKQGAPHLVFTLPAEGGFSGSGQLQVAASLPFMQ